VSRALRGAELDGRAQNAWVNCTHALAMLDAIKRGQSAGVRTLLAQGKGAAKKVKGWGNRRPGDRMKLFLPRLKKYSFGRLSSPGTLFTFSKTTDPIGSLVRRGVTAQLPVILTLF
jgi:hypothetical protein